ncbi:ABC transporter ATP-binding protein [Deinococcus rubellus]|uniref:ABC transporter ATP-binding protein n=1 Tax=Deinococcus rubellus TaxID=1889240 RepID=UPI0031EE6ABA
MPLAILDQLSITFARQPVAVLDQVSLHIRRGERVGLVGESGCGKSLTMLAMMGLLPDGARLTGGTLTLSGTDLPRSAWGHAARPAPGLAMIFQQPTAALNPVFTIGDQLLAVARTQSENRRAARSKLTGQCLRVLDQVRLSDPRRVFASYPFQLSGGMRQRILIALALLRRPTLLIADEPGTALDVTIQAEILALLDELVREENLALLHITHNLGVARETTDRVYVMYGGRVVEHAPTGELFRNPTHPYTVGLLESIPRLDGSGTGVGIPGNVPAASAMPPGCRFQSRCPLAEEACRALEPPADQGDIPYVSCIHPVTAAQRETLWT